MVQPNILNRGSPYRRRCRLLLATLASNLSLAASAHAATYYIAPNGSDGGAGSSGSPWKTFPHAVSQLSPGDTLLVSDGTYTRQANGSGSVIVPVTCGGGAKNGTASAPITVQAEHERQAWLKDDGGGTLLFVNKCSYWNFTGFHASSGDAQGNPSASFFLVTGGDHIAFRRNLLTNPNRRLNQSMITYNTSSYGLIEENELYYYTRHGFLLTRTPNSIVRRNYANSRGYSDNLRVLPGIYNSGSGGDSLVAIYPGSNNIVENNISEGNMSGFNIQASGYGSDSSNNKFYGNISLNDGVGAGLRLRARGNDLYHMPVNTYVENQVVIGDKGSGGDFRANKNTLVTNTSIFNSDIAGFYGNTSEFPGDSPTMAIKNSLAVDNKLYGFGVVNYSSFTVTNSNSFGNGTNYSPGSLASGNMSKDPGLGSCKVFIPDGSPMKGAGADGGDIGANVLCRYENGVLTQTQLWNWQTGQFPCGAIVPGVNDKPGESCFDVNQRLNVNANGCNLPANPICKQPAPPADFPPITGGAPVFYSPDGKVCPSGYKSSSSPPVLSNSSQPTSPQPAPSQPSAPQSGSLYNVPLDNAPELTVIPGSVH